MILAGRSNSCNLYIKVSRYIVLKTFNNSKEIMPIIFLAKLVVITSAIRHNVFFLGGEIFPDTGLFEFLVVTNSYRLNPSLQFPRTGTAIWYYFGA